ncbi:MAG: MATE family efflux transporter, partial [Oscillospiraceae bacterium]
MTKKKFFFQGAILTLISFFLRTTNIFYRSYLSGKIGPEGMGLYQLIFSVFILAVTLSTSGISLAVTRLVSSAIAAGRREEIRSVVARCLLFCLALSLSISCIFFCCSDFAAAVFLGNPKAAGCLKILGLGLPFMSLCTCMKGYFLAVDEGVSSGLADTAEQLITIGSTVGIFTLMPFHSLEEACLGAMAASTLGEI